MMSVLSCGISVQIIHSKDSVSLKKPSAKKNNFLYHLGLKNLFYVILNDFCTLALIRLRRDRAGALISIQQWTKNRWFIDQ